MCKMLRKAGIVCLAMSLCACSASKGTSSMTSVVSSVSVESDTPAESTVISTSEDEVATVGGTVTTSEGAVSTIEPVIAPDDIQDPYAGFEPVLSNGGSGCLWDVHPDDIKYVRVPSDTCATELVALVPITFSWNPSIHEADSSGVLPMTLYLSAGKLSAGQGMLSTGATTFFDKSGINAMRSEAENEGIAVDSIFLVDSQAVNAPLDARHGFDFVAVIPYMGTGSYKMSFSSKMESVSSEALLLVHLDTELDYNDNVMQAGDKDNEIAWKLKERLSAVSSDEEFKCTISPTDTRFVEAKKMCSSEALAIVPFKLEDLAFQSRKESAEESITSVDTTASKDDKDSETSEINVNALILSSSTRKLSSNGVDLLYPSVHGVLSAELSDLIAFLQKIDSGLPAQCIGIMPSWVLGVTDNLSGYIVVPYDGAGVYEITVTATSTATGEQTSLKMVTTLDANVAVNTTQTESTPREPAAGR